MGTLIMTSEIAELRSKDGGNTHDDFLYSRTERKDSGHTCDGILDSRTERQRQWHTCDGILTTDANEHILKPFASSLYWVNFLSFASEKVLIFLPFKQVRVLSLWVTTVLTLSKFCLMYKSKSCLAHCLTPSTCQCLHSKSPLPFSKSSLTHAVRKIMGLRMREFSGETPNGNRAVPCL